MHPDKGLKIAYAKLTHKQDFGHNCQIVQNDTLVKRSFQIVGFCPARILPADEDIKAGVDAESTCVLLKFGKRYSSLQELVE